MCVPLECNFRPLFRWYPHLRWGPPSAFSCFHVYTYVFRRYGPPEFLGRLILGHVGPLEAMHLVDGVDLRKESRWGPPQLDLMETALRSTSWYYFPYIYIYI
jgi:hypothetical protein